MTTNLEKTAHDSDEAILPSVVAAVQAAGRHLKSRFSVDSRPANLNDLLAAIHANDAASLAVLRKELADVQPGVQWAEDESENGALPPGEWWVTDPTEGNINHIHGMPDWGVTATLVRDNTPVLAVVYLPMSDDTYTAVRGGGAYQNGVRLQTSAKTELGAALVGTGQAKPEEEEDIRKRTEASVATMLDSALVVRVSVPSTLQLIQVAAGRMDAFWQYGQVRAGLLPGALLVGEAGGIITDIKGRPWTPASGDFLATASGLHTAAIAALDRVA